MTDTDNNVKRWMDDTGRARWQPQHPHGHRLCYLDYEVGQHWINDGRANNRPVLCRFKWWAQFRVWYKIRQDMRRFRPQ